MSTNLVKEKTIQYSINNQSGADIVVLLNSRPAIISSPNADSLYGQTLKLLQTSETTQVIVSGSLMTVQIKDTDMEDDSLLYEMLCVKSDTFYPLKSVPLQTKDDVSSISVTSQDELDMKLAETFYRNVFINPTSDLVISYHKALINAIKTCTTTEEMDTEMKGFFNSTDKYTTLTFNEVAAITVYYNQYPFIWADYKMSKTYYVYCSDGRTKYYGSITLTNACTVPLSTEKPVPGFSISYIADNGEETELTYGNGRFADDTDADKPAISLVGTFVLKSDLNLMADYQLITGLIGKINGKNVWCSSEKIPITNDDKWLTLYPVFHPSTFADWLILTTSITSFAALIAGTTFVAVKVVRAIRNNMLEADAKSYWESLSRYEDWVDYDDEDDIFTKPDSDFLDIKSLDFWPADIKMNKCRLIQHAQLQQLEAQRIRVRELATVSVGNLNELMMDIETDIDTMNNLSVEDVSAFDKTRKAVRSRAKAYQKKIIKIEKQLETDYEVDLNISEDESTEEWVNSENESMDTTEDAREFYED